MSKLIYLDHAAATPLDPKVIVAMKPYLADNFYNPSATYLLAQKVRKDLELARSDVAQILGAKSGEIVFTAGATEANNLTVFGVKGSDHIVSTAIEHESILAPLQKRVGAFTLVKPNADGLIEPELVARAVTDKTVLVSVMYANNEIGTIQPLRKISLALETIRRERLKHSNKLPLYFHTDAAQAGNYLDLHVDKLGVDMMTLNGGKLYGPKQSGILYIGAHVQLSPLIFGGGQERGLRSGTENVAGDIGFARALTLAQSMRLKESERLKALQHEFITQLQRDFPGVVINGSIEHRLANNVHVTFPGTDNERLVMGLDEKGIMAAAGSACSASSDEPSHVLKAIGKTDKEARSSVRFSLGRHTNSADLQRVVSVLKSLV